jgi:hypothetical protein
MPSAKDINQEVANSFRSGMAYYLQDQPSLADAIRCGQEEARYAYFCTMLGLTPDDFQNPLLDQQMKTVPLSISRVLVVGKDINGRDLPVPNLKTLLVLCDRKTPVPLSDATQIRGRIQGRQGTVASSKGKMVWVNHISGKDSPPPKVDYSDPPPPQVSESPSSLWFLFGLQDVMSPAALVRWFGLFEEHAPPHFVEMLACLSEHPTAMSRGLWGLAHRAGVQMCCRSGEESPVLVIMLKAILRITDSALSTAQWFRLGFQTRQQTRKELCTIADKLERLANAIKVAIPPLLVDRLKACRTTPPEDHPALGLGFGLVHNWHLDRFREVYGKGEGGEKLCPQCLAFMPSSFEASSLALYGVPNPGEIIRKGLEKGDLALATFILRRKDLFSIRRPPSFRKEKLSKEELDYFRGQVPKPPTFREALQRARERHGERVEKLLEGRNPRLAHEEHCDKTGTLLFSCPCRSDGLPVVYHLVGKIPPPLLQQAAMMRFHSQAMETNIEMMMELCKHCGFGHSEEELLLVLTFDLFYEDPKQALDLYHCLSAEERAATAAAEAEAAEAEAAKARKAAAKAAAESEAAISAAAKEYLSDSDSDSDSD